jgi:hypothetical protein
MQEYIDSYLQNLVEKITRYQREGKFIAVDDYMTDRLPLPNIEELPGMSLNMKSFSYTAPWGSFIRSNTSGVWVLSEGTPPFEQLPLRSITATVRQSQVFIGVDGQSVPLPLHWQAGENTYVLLAKINTILIADPTLHAVACRLTWDENELDKRIHELRLSNEHISVVCGSLAWDEEHHQLVAATLVSPEAQSLRAITATLATNAKKSLTITIDGESHFIQNTRRGFIRISGNLAAVGAEGHLLTILNPLTGNPQDQSDEVFYVVASQAETLAAKFAERLNLAIPFPVRPEWAEYLLETGLQAGLVQTLSLAGEDFPAAVSVQRQVFAWQEILEHGLKKGVIQL